MMTQVPGGGDTPHRPTLPKDHPCYGCSFAGQVCVGICHRELLTQLNDTRRKKL